MPRKESAKPPLGGARVNFYGQTLGAQLDQPRRASCKPTKPIFREKVTGAQADRREVLRLLKTLARDDVVTVTRIDRLGPLDLRPVRHR
jgi:DNA invertase Pin-like site-specific DNA recombinase